MNDIEGLYSVPQAAAKLGVGERIMRDMIDTGEIGCVRVRRRVLIAPRQIEDYIAANSVPARRRITSDAKNPHYRPLSVVPPAC